MLSETKGGFRWIQDLRYQFIEKRWYYTSGTWCCDVTRPPFVLDIFCYQCTFTSNLFTRSNYFCFDFFFFPPSFTLTVGMAATNPTEHQHCVRDLFLPRAPSTAQQSKCPEHYMDNTSKRILKIKTSKSKMPQRLNKPTPTWMLYAGCITAGGRGGYKQNHSTVHCM